LNGRLTLLAWPAWPSLGCFPCAWRARRCGEGQWGPRRHSSRNPPPGLSSNTW
jgi:hypothetical protein